MAASFGTLDEVVPLLNESLAGLVFRMSLPGEDQLDRARGIGEQAD